MARRTRQILAPPDRRRIEHEVVFRTGVNGGCPLLWIHSPLQCRSFGDDLQTRNVFRWISVILPPDQAGDGLAFLHPGSIEDPVVRFRADPVTASVHGIDVSRTHQVTLVWTVVWKRAVVLFAGLGEFVIPAIRPASEDDAIGIAV